MAAAGFRTRRVRSEQSIGDRLKRSRTRQKISVAEVEESTRIRAKFILALESDSWDQIPSEVYGRGYLERYLEFLKMPVDDIMKEYLRSRTTYSRLCQDAGVDLAPKSSIRIPRFVLTPRLLIICLLSVGILAVGGVVGGQVRRFTAAPFLQLITPAEAQASDGSQLFVATNTVTMSGKTAIGAEVKINGVLAPVDDQGSFSQAVAVQHGINAIMVEATTSNGKTSKEVRTVIVK